MQPESIAFLEDSSRMYYAYHPADHPQAPVSAVISLIQGIWEQNPSQALHLLRKRIVASGPAFERDQAFIKVAAKRVLWEESLGKNGFGKENLLKQYLLKKPTTLPNQLIDLTPLAEQARIKAAQASRPPIPLEWRSQPAADTVWMERAIALAQGRSAPPHQPRHARHRPVAALLLDSAGFLLDWAINTHAQNRTLHAEVNLVQGFWIKNRTLPPDGSRVLLTLQSCQMCAALLSAWAPPLQEVVFFAKDPGPLARQTALHRRSLEKHYSTR